MFPVSWRRGGGISWGSHSPSWVMTRLCQTPCSRDFFYGTLKVLPPSLSPAPGSHTDLRLTTSIIESPEMLKHH